MTKGLETPEEIFGQLDGAWNALYHFAQHVSPQQEEEPLQRYITVAMDPDSDARLLISLHESDFLSLGVVTEYALHYVRADGGRIALWARQDGEYGQISQGVTQCAPPFPGGAPVPDHGMEAFAGVLSGLAFTEWNPVPLEHWAMLAARFL